MAGERGVRDECHEKYYIILSAQGVETPTCRAPRAFTAQPHSKKNSSVARHALRSTIFSRFFLFPVSLDNLCKETAILMFRSASSSLHDVTNNSPAQIYKTHVAAETTHLHIMSLWSRRWQRFVSANRVTTFLPVRFGDSKKCTQMFDFSVEMYG